MGFFVKARKKADIFFPAGGRARSLQIALISPWFSSTRHICLSILSLSMASPAPGVNHGRW